MNKYKLGLLLVVVGVFIPLITLPFAKSNHRVGFLYNFTNGMEIVIVKSKMKNIYRYNRETNKSILTSSEKITPEVTVQYKWFFMAGASIIFMGLVLTVLSLNFKNFKKLE